MPAPRNDNFAVKLRRYCISRWLAICGQIIYNIAIVCFVNPNRISVKLAFLSLIAAIASVISSVKFAAPSSRRDISSTGFNGFDPIPAAAARFSLLAGNLPAGTQGNWNAVIPRCREPGMTGRSPL
jgi:hypothetical protein